MEIIDEVFDFHRPQIAMSIARALIRLMSAEEVIDNFDLTFKQYWKIRLELINRLTDLVQVKEIKTSQIADLLDRLLVIEEHLPSKKRNVLDNTVGYLIGLLFPIDQMVFVKIFIQHRRKSRRNIAYQIIRRHSQTDDRILLIQAFDRFKDQDALTTLTRIDTNITDIASRLVDVVENLYEKARVFEKLCLQDFVVAAELASDYPGAFCWGAARSGKHAAIPLIVQFLDSNVLPVKEISLAIWSLGKLEAKDELKNQAEIYGVHISNFLF